MMDHEILEKFVDLGRQLAQTRELVPLLESAVDIALDFMEAEYGYLVLVDDQGALDFQVCRDQDGNMLEQPQERISYTIFEDVVSSGEALIIDDAVSSIQSESALRLQLSSVMCVPLISRGKILGAIYVENRTEKNLFRDNDLKLLEYFASLAAVAIENAIANQQLEEEIAERKRAEEELRKHRDHLEERVRERTAEMRKVINAMAGREVRMIGLKDAIRKLRAQLEAAGLAPVADDPLLAGWKE